MSSARIGSGCRTRCWILRRNLCHPSQKHMHIIPHRHSLSRWMCQICRQNDCMDDETMGPILGPFSCVSLLVHQLLTFNQSEGNTTSLIRPFSHVFISYNWINDSVEIYLILINRRVDASHRVWFGFLNRNVSIHTNSKYSANILDDGDDNDDWR